MLQVCVNVCVRVCVCIHVSFSADETESEVPDVCLMYIYKD